MISEKLVNQEMLLVIPTLIRKHICAIEKAI